MTEEDYRALEKAGFTRADARLVIDLGKLAATDAMTAIKRVASRAPSIEAASAITHFALCAIAEADRMLREADGPKKPPALAVRLINYFRRKEGQ